jgi:hypothetical protein
MESQTEDGTVEGKVEEEEMNRRDLFKRTTAIAVAAMVVPAIPAEVVAEPQVDPRREQYNLFMDYVKHMEGTVREFIPRPYRASSYPLQDEAISEPPRSGVNEGNFPNVGKLSEELMDSQRVFSLPVRDNLSGYAVKQLQDGVRMGLISIPEARARYQAMLDSD